MVLNSLCYKNYLIRCKVQFFRNPKKFYNLVNTKRKSTNYPSSLYFENLSDRSFCQVVSNDIFYFISLFTTLFLQCILV